MNNMNTPIFDFVNKYCRDGFTRLHMPGHKGNALLGPEPLDITEIEGADVLYSDSGIIKESSKNASELFNTFETLYSTEGSSLSIRAMLYLTALFAKEQGKPLLVLAGRNAHKAFLSGAALTGLRVEWLYPKGEDGLLSLRIDPNELELYLSNRIKEGKELPTALYITSPDYLGSLADIKEISRVCRQFGLLLLADNAHGAYLHFLESSRHPIHLGADLCCDSAHKTLPALTGGAYLHISDNAPDFIKRHARQAMMLFASTSPSYLILQSLDLTNAYLSDGYKEKLSSLEKQVSRLKKALTEKGYCLFGDEPLKITICAKEYGYLGTELAKILVKNGIICEFSDPDFLVLMLSTESSQKDLNKLEATLLALQKRQRILTSAPKVNKLFKALDIREALFSPDEEILTENAEGRVLSSYCVSCPPAVPIAVCGELLDKSAINALKYYGITKVRVIKSL